MDPINTNGVEALPDSLASAGTSEGEVILEAPVIDPPVEDESISEETPSGVEGEDDISEDLKAEMESVIESNPNDSDLIKKLRGLVKTKFDDFVSKTQPELSESQQFQQELVNGLFEFDIDKGTPTTRRFAEAIAKKDINLAAQAFDDLSAIALEENGYTLGHKFLEKIGLDPYKIEELRQFSRGELNPTDYGIVNIPDTVPKDLIEAYKSLDPISRTDVDLYLDSENDAQKAAALRSLRDRQANIDNDKYRQEAQTRQEAQFTSEVYTATESDLETTYTGVLASLKSNPAYTNITISSDKNVDTMVKDSVIAQLNALGDPRSVLAIQAKQTLEARGVKVDLPKIESLMATIEDASKIAITADKMGKLHNRDYSTQIQEALARKTTAVSSLIALGNKYFSQTLANLTGVNTNTPAPVGSIPNVDGAIAPIVTKTPGIKTPAELDAEIMNIAKSLRAGAV